MVKSLNLVDLDFATNKADLIAFFQTQPLFKDYDFTGSNLNLLADLLAYNSNKHAFLTNMLMAEAFLDSAQLTASVFSHAKDLNYLPRSPRSAKATIAVAFQATSVSQPYIIPKGSSFATLIKNQSYVFTTAETLSIASANTLFQFTTDIYEGVYLRDSYVYVTSIDNPYPRFRITNKNVDTTSLLVAVFEDNAPLPTSYRLATSLLDLDNSSKVFFLQTSENGFYEVMFGDGIVGFQPKQNATIVLEYRITQADKSNGAQNFNINFDPTGMANELNGAPVITTLNAGAGGAIAESLESVRYYAPRFFQTQERMIVPTDYEVLLKTQFPEINAVSAWGGEQQIPPRFGYTMVAIDLPGFTTLPITKEDEYKAFILRRAAMSIRPIFVDPDHLYAQINSTVRYNINVTTNTPSRMQSLVATAIANYNINNLNDFNVTLRSSNLGGIIEDADPSIVSDTLEINIYKKLLPTPGVMNNIIINFNVALEDDFAVLGDSHDALVLKCLRSSNFTYRGETASLEDDGAGVVRVVKTVNGVVNKVSEIGNISYVTGLVALNLTIDNWENDFFKIFVVPADKDIVVINSTILSIESDEINLTIETVSE